MMSYPSPEDTMFHRGIKMHSWGVEPIRVICEGMADYTSFKPKGNAYDIDFSTDEPGWLLQQRQLHSRHARGNTSYLPYGR
jgi:hypothetical protein